MIIEKINTRRLGDQLRELRLQAGMTQEQVGEMLGFTKNAISHYEQGIRTPSIDVLESILYLYGYDIFIERV